MILGEADTALVLYSFARSLTVVVFGNSERHEGKFRSGFLNIGAELTELD